MPGKLTLGTASGGYYGPYSGPYGLWDLTTGGKPGPDRAITCDTSPMAEVDWIHRHPKAEALRVGLISWAGTYLTFEAYKSTVTATAKSLGRRQVTRRTWTRTHFLSAVCLCMCADVYACVHMCLCACVCGDGGVSYLFCLSILREVLQSSQSSPGVSLLSQPARITSLSGT